MAKETITTKPEWLKILQGVLCGGVGMTLFFLVMPWVMKFFAWYNPWVEKL